MRFMKWKLAALGVAVVVAACGGGGDPVGPKTSITRVVVAGDSLADAGTFGAKFTVQNAKSPSTGYPVYAQIVAENYGLADPCNFFASSTGGASFTTNATCTDYAVGGAQIMNPASQGGASAPFSLGFQLGTALQVNGGAWKTTDLLVIDAGGNDAAALVTAYLGAASGSAGVAAYQAFLAQELDAATIGATLTQPNGAALAAGLYMQKLADTYWNTVKSTTLDKGATHVALLNMTDVTRTPRFQAVLAQVAAANGGGTTGATAAATLQGAIQQWIRAFNTRLAADVAADSRIALVPFYEDFTDEMNNPANYALTNVVAPVCSDTGFPATCVDAQLDAAAGKTAGWWTNYLYSNSFHPTPYGHHLLAASTARAIARAGWI